MLGEAIMLNMIRADISARDFQRWMGSRRLQDPDHAMHCLLTESFGALAPRPFRIMFPPGGQSGCLYGYASADADALREAAELYACPLQSRIIPAAGLGSKPMPAEWTAGKRLGFETRVRPVVRPSRGGGSARAGKEWDAFQAEAEQHPKGEMNRSRESVYADWLAEQLLRRGGAKLESATLRSFQRVRALRKAHSRYSEGPDALLRGVLNVTDGDAFAHLLARGVGRHRAYGYGMLLLRPAGSAVGP